MADAHITPLASFRDEFRAWLAAASPPPLTYWVSVRTTNDVGMFEELRSWQRRLAESGWLGVDWPAERGGRGLPTLYQSAVYEELVRAGAPLPIGVVGLDVIGPTLVTYGSAGQQAELLPAILSGDDLWCQAFSEPEAGSDLASLKTRARLDGDKFVITGHKIWTSFAKQAAWAAVLARTGEGSRHRGISYILVPMSSPGITIKPIEQITGDSEFNEVFFEEVCVSAANLVGELNGGWQVAMETLSHERSYHLLQRRVNVDVALGECVRALAREYPGQAGHLHRAGLVERLGHLATSAAVLGARVNDIIARLDGSQVPVRGIESVDKLLLSRTEQELFSLLEDVLGAYRQSPDSRPLGISADQVIHDYLYSRSMSIAGGAREIQLNIVATRVLGLPR